MPVRLQLVLPLGPLIRIRVGPEGDELAGVLPLEAEVCGRAYALLRETLSRLTDRTVFGYCGDARQWQHDLNVGFVPAGPPHLLVIWNSVLSQPDKERLIAQAAALGAF